MDDEIKDALTIKEWTRIYDRASKNVFLFDKWEKANVPNYLLGIDSLGGVKADVSKMDPKPEPKFEADRGHDTYICDGLVTVDNKQYNQYEHLNIIRAFKEKRAEIEFLLSKSNLTDDSSPQEYIDWYLSKGFEISWLDWAIDNEFYKTSDSKKVVQTEFDDREIKSMLKIIFCLAKKHYKYEEDGTVTKIIKDIQSMPVEDQKYRVDIKTLTKFLKLAKKSI